MNEISKPGLPTTKIGSPFALKHIISPSRIRQIQRTIRNLKITLLCSCVTILMLRGTIGAGKFGTPAQDLQEIREHIYWPQRDAPSRVLTEAKEETENLLQEQEPNEDFHHDASGAYTLGPRISDWDEQRKAWLMENQHTAATINGKPRILLVTGSQPKACSNPEGDHILLKSIKNKIDYCRLHGIDIFYNVAHLDLEMAGYWAKLPLIREMLLAHPEIEWLWWMDSDALFTDMEFELPIERYGQHNLILHGWDELVYGKRSWTGLNTGSFLIRNCQWSLDLLDSWAPMGPKGPVRLEAGKLLTQALSGRPSFEADDQSALVHLLVTQRAKWGDKVYLENSYYLHGYWAILVDKFEDMMEKHHPGLGDDRWPFVTHFVGCKPCGGHGDYQSKKCLSDMERAFNFADNQVLQAYGFKHTNLGSTSVKRTSKELGRLRESH
ncbi:hypothetical protein O6H91_19G026400 [Diphasiastrum complanatum]|nr:hypothetical protein O6H91_19G026400 [Diphasiastrum complanatum]